ncbi:neutral zinc metallopeptidase [Nonomuraea diastatica]|uniref:neutral zinc metallopeptidase n=1 Tax=Nonomuraea diastatica TaxID=1848329 RepID=UPI001FE8BD93|nr:neutral zinc metallopeptidase [Nonomuraea diastatica]
MALTMAVTSQVFVLSDVASASAASSNQIQQAVHPLAGAAVSTQSRSASANKSLATRNRIYRTGRLTDVNCSPGALPSGSTRAYKRFLTRVTNCLNKAWGSQFRKARMPFSKPRLRIITRKVNTPCGRWSTGADGYYCSSNRTMYMLITRKQLRQPFPLGIARLMAHEYGHHVQQISKIWSYYWTARNSAGRSQRLALSRRSELQAECFSGAFMSTLRDGSHFSDRQWNYTVDWFRKNGAKAWPQNDHGRGPTQAAWMTRGYNSGSPGSCNTWVASARSTT